MQRSPTAVIPAGAAPAGSTRAAGLPLQLPSEALTTQRRIYRRLPLWAWVSIFGLCFAAVLPVLQTSGQTEAGQRLLELEAQRETLRSGVRGLAAEVGSLASLSRIEREARLRLGMVAAPPTRVIQVDHAPPERTLPSRFSPVFERESESRTPAWQALAELLIID